MLHKTKFFKHTNLIIVAFLAINSLTTYAQQPIKIDGVSVVIGSNIVLDSDLEKFKLDLKINSEDRAKITDCEILEQIMLNKLLSHHAVIDSITVSDVEINARVNQAIDFLKNEYGSEEKAVAKYGFNNLEDLRAETYRVQKENLLVREEQQSITQNINVTPEEVRLYYNSLKEKGELPEFQAEVEIAQIVINIEPTEQELERIVSKLKELKKEIEDGASIRFKAIINSDDPAVVQNGGKYTVTKDANFINEFKEMAFSLDVNEVSVPFKSSFGYHLMQLHEIKGNTRVASHILMQPKIDDDRIKEAKQKVQDIIKEIKSGEITFNEAVKKYSEDKESKNNYGLLINPYTGETTYDLTRMDPTLYARISDLKKGEMTDAFYDVGQNREKVFKFILVKDKTDTHIADLVNDYVKIKRLALQKKKQEHLAKWSKEKIKETYIKISDSQQKCSFKNNWKKEIN